MSDRLAPTTTPDTKFFWDALKEGKLLIQRCARLRDAAPSAAADVPALQLARLGHDRVLRDGARSTASCCRATRRGRGSRAPTSSRWSSSRRGRASCRTSATSTPSDVTIGMPVQAFIEHFDNGVSLPQFRPRGGAA